MKIKAFIILLLISIFSLVACATTENIYEDESFVPTVENSTIIYGRKSHVKSVVFLIQSESGNYKLLRAECPFPHSAFYISTPLPVGTELKVIRCTTDELISTVTIHYLIAGVDFVTVKPGLQYIDFFYNDDPENRDDRERTALKVLAKHIKDKKWKALIKERLEELK
ncbi:MAG: hypothetical protein J5527_02675 [Treponema sp.]|nr:hypothetical protein [Treponema sp.]